MDNNNNDEKSYLDLYNEYMESVSEQDSEILRYVNHKENEERKERTEREHTVHTERRTVEPRPVQSKAPVRQREQKRKHKSLLTRRNIAVVMLVVAVVIVICIVVSCASNKVPETKETVATTVAPTTVSNSYQIQNVNVISQDNLLAGCEIYACTMLLQYLEYDIDEFEFADNYLITYPMSWDEDGNRYGPDMNSAFAGDVYTGFGINAPAMTKSMNSYLDTTDKGKKAYDTTGTSLEQLCEDYVKRDIPVMVWATARMDEPYIEKTWIVNYVDENATTKIGDTYGWNEHEHCLLLVGYDEENYYFCDSLEGCIMGYERKITETRYEQLGSQSIVVK